MKNDVSLRNIMKFYMWLFFVYSIGCGSTLTVPAYLGSNSAQCLCCKDQG